MRSRWSHLKEKAITLRRKPLSIGEIERRLSIPRSTLSGWFRDVVLTPEQKKILKERSIKRLSQARSNALNWHRNQKEIRIALATSEAKTALQYLSDTNPTLELALAMLYLGEGAKAEKGLMLGNSNPLIISFYISALEKLYGIKRESLRFDLHLRLDQDENALKRFWAEQLHISIEQIKYVLYDKRTANKPTWPDYHGVCSVTGGGVAIQRKLLYLARQYAEFKAIPMRG